MTTRFNAEINVTPLIDVCLVLLIIFMIVLPSIVNVGDIQLPETKKADELTEKIFPVTVKADGTVYLERLIVRNDEVPGALKHLRTTAASRPIAIRADKRARYGDVLDVLGACRDAGWRDVTLVASASANKPLRP